MDRSGGSRFRVLLCLVATAIGASALVATDACAQGVKGAATVVTTNGYGRRDEAIALVAECRDRFAGKDPD